jgi:hypoxanthine phosphoribosyltransferase
LYTKKIYQKRTIVARAIFIDLQKCISPSCFLLTGISALGTVAVINNKGWFVDNLHKEVLYPKDVIDKKVRELAGQISSDYEGKELIVIGILKGAFIFMADLIRCLTIPCRVDFVRLASYGAGMSSSGKVVMTKDIETFIKDKDILIVEDVVDTGLTLSYLLNWLKERSPRTIKVCAFLDKRKRRKTPFEADYVGFVIEDGFVVGYGLDFNEKARFLPDIYVVRE